MHEKQWKCIQRKSVPSNIQYWLYASRHQSYRTSSELLQVCGYVHCYIFHKPIISTWGHSDAQFSPPRCTPPRLHIFQRLLAKYRKKTYPPVAKTLIPARAANIRVPLHVVPPSLCWAIAGAISLRESFTTDGFDFVSARYSNSEGFRPILMRPPSIPIVAGIEPVERTIRSTDWAVWKFVGLRWIRYSMKLRIILVQYLRHSVCDDRAL